MLTLLNATIIVLLFSFPVIALYKHWLDRPTTARQRLHAYNVHHGRKHYRFTHRCIGSRRDRRIYWHNKHMSIG
jgi:hypothetical protein